MVITTANISTKIASQRAYHLRCTAAIMPAAAAIGAQMMAIHHCILSPPE